MRPAPALARKSLSDQIKETLLDRIVQGHLAPGERLIELKIASEMQTSQAPVREAIRELEVLGVVETLRNKGARVRTFDEREMREIYDVRAIIEGHAAEVVARAGVPIKTKLEEQNRKMRAVAKSGQSAAFSDHNSAFHRIILDACGNETLSDLWSRLNIKARTMVNVIRQDASLTDIANSHVEIVKAIASGDPEKAREVSIEHVLDNRP